MQTNNNFDPNSQENMAQANHKAVEKKNVFRSLSWLLWVVVVGLVILGGFYLRPLLAPEVKADTAAVDTAAIDTATVNVIEQAPIDTANVANEGSAPGENSNAHEETIMQTVIANARHFDGDPNAPITLVEFADFNCGYCGKWALETLPQIHEKYVDTGKVQIAYVNYPVLGTGSVAAAQASECAAQQDKFWEYHNALYQNRSAGLTADALINLAGQTGMDTVAFGQCITNFPEKLLENDILLGQAMGIRGTPAFLINGIALAGAYPYEQFEQIIESLLAEQ